MKIKHLMMLMLATPVLAQANECEIDATVIGAAYKVQDSNQAGQHNEFEMTLWRDDRRVAHEYKDTHMTNLWEQVSNGSVRLVRFFDEDHRAIEYQPGEVQYDNDTNQWQRMYQLVTQQMLQDMELTSSKGQGCDLEQHYQLEKDGVMISMIWLSNLNLVSEMTETTEAGSRHWQMSELINEQSKVKAAFSERDAYQSTDYADIGDNESDPFLMKMINLGHISHGASGFYDEDGHQLGGGHAH